MILLKNSVSSDFFAPYQHLPKAEGVARAASALRPDDMYFRWTLASMIAMRVTLIAAILFK